MPPVSFLPAVLCTFLFLLGSVRAEEAKPVLYRLEFMLVSLPGAVGDLAVATDAEGETVIRSGDFLLQLGTEILWDGQPKPTDRVEVLSAPQLAVAQDREALIRIGENPGYFVRRCDGLFEYRLLPEDESSGISLAARVSAVDDGAEDEALLTVDLRMARITGREPVPGVAENVGRPLLNTRESKSTVRMRSGVWAPLSGGESMSDGGRTDLVLARVSRWNPEN